MKTNTEAHINAGIISGATSGLSWVLLILILKLPANFKLQFDQLTDFIFNQYLSKDIIFFVIVGFIIATTLLVLAEDNAKVRIKNACLFLFFHYLFLFSPFIITVTLFLLLFVSMGIGCLSQPPCLTHN